MATYIGGLNVPKGFKINNQAAEKFINNAVSRAVQHTITVGKAVNEDIRKKYTIEWFRYMGFPISYHTMLDSLRFGHQVKQNKTQISVIFTSYVDPSLYDIEHTNLYKYRDKYGNLDATSYIVESLQWNRGILGLPAHSDFGYSTWENHNLHQGIPMSSFTKPGMAWAYKWHWIKQVNQLYSTRYSDGLIFK